MPSPQEEAFVRGRRVGHLATADARGRPFVIPVCFVYLDGRVYTPVDEKPKSGRPLRRLRNIADNEHVSIVFDRYDDDWSRLGWVLLQGTASLVDDAAERTLALATLREKYRQYESMALEERPLIRIDPELWSSWGAL